MAMQTFNFPYHKFSTKYPESGNRVQLGNSYVFAAPPSGPDLRVFTLKFPVMFYYLNGAGEIDATQNPLLNMKVLENFYNEHKLYKNFIYPHPVYGNCTVKFNRPLEIPEGVHEGGGALNDFQIELMEQLL